MFNNFNFLNGKKVREIIFDPHDIAERDSDPQLQPRNFIMDSVRKQIPHQPILFDQGFLNKRPLDPSYGYKEQNTTLPPFETFAMLAKMESNHIIPTP